jgi:hypothetical protein
VVNGSVRRHEAASAVTTFFGRHRFRTRLQGGGGDDDDDDDQLKESFV